MVFNTELPGTWLDALIEDAAASTAGLTPVLINLDPDADETAIVRATDIALDIATLDPVSGTIDVNATKIYVNDALAFDGGLFTAGFDGADSAFSNPQSDVLRVRIDPTFEFDSEQVVLVRVLSRAAGDTSLLDSTYQFTIEDYLGPRVIDAQAVDLNRVRVQFSEALTTLTALQVSAWQLDRFGDYVRPLVAADVVRVEVGVTSETVDLITDIPLTPGGAYQVTATGILDEHGNPVMPPFNATMFTGWTPPAPDGRNLDLYRKFPDFNRGEDNTLDLLRMVGCIQEVAALLLYDIDQFIEILDPDTAAEDVVDTMLLDLGNPFSFELTLTDKRRLANVLVAMYQLKGTAPGIKNVIRFFLSTEVEIAAYNTMQDGWVLGESELGVGSILVSNLQSNLYSFDVVAAQLLTDETRTRIRAIVAYMKPAHTHFIRLIEPTTPVVESEFLPLGEAMLGANWRLGTSPALQLIAAQSIYSAEYLGLPSLTYATPFSMAAKTLTLWWRGGNYSDGGAGSANASWNGQASAGTSGTRNAGTILDPAAASLNSLDVPDFNGGVGAAGSALALPVALSNFVTASAWTMGILFYCDTATVDGATVDLNQLIFGDGAGRLGLFVSSHSGGEVQLLQLSAGPTLNVARAPLVTGSWVYAHCSCSGGNISLDVNGTPVVTAAADIVDLTNGLRIGRIGSLTSFDGKVAEIMVAASGAHWTRANAVSYLNDRYGLSLT